MSSPLLLASSVGVCGDSLPTPILFCLLSLVSTQQYGLGWAGTQGGVTAPSAEDCAWDADTSSWAFSERTSAAAHHHRGSCMGPARGRELEIRLGGSHLRTHVGSEVVVVAVLSGRGHAGLTCMGHTGATTPWRPQRAPETCPASRMPGPGCCCPPAPSSACSSLPLTGPCPRGLTSCCNMV